MEGWCPTSCLNSKYLFFFTSNMAIRFTALLVSHVFLMVEQVGSLCKCGVSAAIFNRNWELTSV